MVLLIITGIIFILYAGIIFFYYRSWRSIPYFNDMEYGKSQVPFSVIVAARNEEKNIGTLLQSLQNQTYPKSLFEIIIVDDHSTDATADIVKTFTDVKLISLQNDPGNSYKKKAIETGIAHAQNEWIVCTDADCIAPPNWLSLLANYIYREQPVFIAAPVCFTAGHSLLNSFQTLDFLTLQGITGASVYKKVHSMCNGANLAYKKNVFYEVDGFAGIDHIASGDDMLLMHKIWKLYPDGVKYVKSANAIMLTEAAATWKQFFNQRIRWASKSMNYDDTRIFAVLLLVYFCNFSFLVLGVASFFDIKYFYALIILWMAKTFVEWPFLRSITTFFKKEKLLSYFFFLQPMHIAYTIIAGFLGSFGKYEWKGRRVK